MLLIVWLIKRYNINFREGFFHLSPDEIELIGKEEVKREKKITSTLLLALFFIIIQGMFINMYNWSRRLSHLFDIELSFFTSSEFINIIVIILSIFLIWLVQHMVGMLKIQRNEIIEKIKRKSKERLDWELRMQYHDFNHHLGMLSMMLQMDQVSAAKKYLKGMVKELGKIKKLESSGNPALNALIQSKIARGQKMGVKIDVELVNPLKGEYIPDWELVRVCGNLLDNSIEALQQLPRDTEKRVKIEIDGEKDILTISVTTFGVVIPDEIKEHIFERGFTSKKEKGHGLGLAICKEITDKYQGQISIRKDEERETTTFTVKLPKNT
ncbi:sensor histidine kinase [Halothermothrix orenii]|uniref:histidine kinase n=1 Tax=Halothermothrix orenii (strain H 168 / OCM 544 / DSM 9562) TaxID=373903 RepID=B8D0V6_HALOH|nr:ATP-binding protein [Halothermothrix orenii]ACL68925.1 signal transduction histidine kinase regulating citrate/malate metabolism [Halothermothrix orenii H 168]